MDQPPVAPIAQFLVETSVLSAVGTGIGPVVGRVAPSFVTWSCGMETRITISAPVVAVLVSLAVGVVSGMYPAHRGSIPSKPCAGSRAC